MASRCAVADAAVVVVVVVVLLLYFCGAVQGWCHPCKQAAQAALTNSAARVCLPRVRRPPPPTATPTELFLSDLTEDRDVRRQLRPLLDLADRAERKLLK